MNPRLAAIALGVAVGLATRYSVLKVDYRRYPSYPHGYLTHLALGLVAAFLGAVAIPAIVDQEYAAATFLALAATQFREIRSIEREKLRALDAQELVPRGNTYIEGIARVFEARNYLVMLVALVTGAATEFGGLVPGLFTGGVALIVARAMKSGRRLSEVADIEIVDVRFDGPNMYVGDVYIMNLALESARRQVSEWGVGLLLRPRDENARDTVDNVGQRQAIIHDVSTILGNRIDVATPEFTPMARKNQETGTVGVYLAPMSRNEEALRAAVERVPVLESAQGGSLNSLAGRMARD